MAADEPSEALQRFLTEFRRVSSAIVDSYFVVDHERRIVDFNRAFFALLPRQLARAIDHRSLTPFASRIETTTDCSSGAMAGSYAPPGSSAITYGVPFVRSRSATSVQETIPSVKWTV